MANKDVKELARLAVIEHASEVSTVVWSCLDKWGKRDQWEEALIAFLEYDDCIVVGNVAGRLGTMKCKRAVPALLSTLQSDRNLIRRWEHTRGDIRKWGTSNARSHIIAALGEIGDKRAVVVLETYLNPPKHEVYGGNAAFVLHKLTGMSYSFMDHDGKVKVYPPQEQSNAKDDNGTDLNPGK